MPDKKTIHLITEYQKRVRIETYWKECFLDIDFSEYNVNIIDGTHISHDSLLFSDTHYKSTQLKIVMDLISNNGVKRGDIFIFVNAWNFISVPLSYFKNEFGMDFKMIGFWGNSLFNQQSPMWQRFKKRYKNWGREFELSLFDAYDLNCFLCEEHWQLFKSKYPARTRKPRTKVAVTGYPFEYITRIPNNQVKEDIIVFPYEINRDVQVNVFRGLKSQLPQFEWVFAQEKYNNRLHYLNLLRKSKVMFCGNDIEYNPVLLWEGMILGLIPLVPKKEMFYYFFPERYQYPYQLSIPKNNKFLYLLRNRLQMEQIICSTFDSYNKNIDQLKIDASLITDKYYRNAPFLEQLQNL